MNHWIVGLALVLAPSGRIAAQAQALQPELFGKGLISTELDELNAAFTPDGKELYYSISAPDGRMGVIMVSRLNGQQWSKPEVVPFSGRYTDYDPFVTVDGSKLFFISTRPSGEQPKAPGDFDIWVVERQGTSWGEPRNLGGPVNSERPEYYPSVARDGTLYFSTQREGSGGFDVFRSKLVDGKYTTPENLGPGINGPGSDIDNYIAPDQSFLVWAGYGRQGAPGGGDLFISWFKDGAWTPGQLLGHAPVGRGGEVEGDRALVAVDRQVVGGHALADRRQPGAGVVAARALDLDHVGAQVAEQHRGVGPGQHTGEVGDQDAVQRTSVRSCLLGHQPAGDRVSRGTAW